MSALLDELHSLVNAFNGHDTEYAVCGALAMAIHGFPRATMGIDVLIRKESLDAALGIAFRNGYNVQEPDDPFTSQALHLTKVVAGVVVTLKVLLVVAEIEDIWKSRENVVFEEHPMSVVSHDGLIKLKSRYAQPQDLADICRMENEEAYKSKDIEASLRQVDQLHTLSVELLKAGKAHYENLVNEGKASDTDLARYRKYLA